MFDSYGGRMVLAGMIGFAVSFAALFGGQLLLYWLIDKYTKLSFPIAYRIVLALPLTFVAMFYIFIR